ncbi:MAG: hypothetical protein K8R36_00230 [Planctomycetales bacterium]|nr:hypothetical protein [Planctomycetales bacterium]
MKRYGYSVLFATIGICIAAFAVWKMFTGYTLAGTLLLIPSVMNIGGAIYIWLSSAKLPKT